jgi:hypothetical protein
MIKETSDRTEFIFFELKFKYRITPKINDLDKETGEIFSYYWLNTES